MSGIDALLWAADACGFDEAQKGALLLDAVRFCGHVPVDDLLASAREFMELPPDEQEAIFNMPPYGPLMRALAPFASLEMDS